ncbi:MAG TPA: L,D-transpeptidase family protein [Thermoleophilaceae bacterium]|jgi:hypothetical protein
MRPARSLPTASALLALALAPAAAAQTVPVEPPAAPAPAPPATPAPEPAAAKLSVGVASVGDRGRRWVLADERLVAVGRLDPFVDGQRVVVTLYRGKKRLGSRTVKVRDVKGHGQFTVAFGGVGKTGAYSVLAKHKKTAQQKGATSKRARFGAIAGSAGRFQDVRLLQIGLRRLAYVTPLTGHFQAATRRAVLAFRKVNGMSRSMSPSQRIFKMLFRGLGGYRLRHPKAGQHVEVSLSRAVLVLADRGVPQRIYHASPGKPSTPTVRGAFSFYRKQPGTNSHGMVHSVYFHGGYAIHGYKSVPAFPASHGCVRVPIANALSIYRSIRLGEKIFVYR